MVKDAGEAVRYYSLPPELGPFGSITDNLQGGAKLHTKKAKFSPTGSKRTLESVILAEVKKPGSHQKWLCHEDTN